MKKISVTFLALACLWGCTLTDTNQTDSQSLLQKKIAKELKAPEIATAIKAKPVVQAKKFMVVAAHPLAAVAGNEILKKGGSAVDAAIATSLVLNLVEPQSSGIGGGGFMVYYDQKSQQMLSFDGRETAPMATKPDHFLLKNKQPMDFDTAATGGGAVAIPGLVKMFALAHQKYGKLPWADLFKPAITLAENGFPMGERLHLMLQQAPHYKNLSDSYAMYFDANQQLKPVGSIITNKPLANTFKIIAKEGAYAFYHGKIAKDIVDTVQNAKQFPAPLTLQDLAGYQAKTRDVNCISYHEYQVCGMMPPSSGGVTVLQALKMLEHTPLRKLAPYSPDAVHLIISASRLAYADRNKYLADPDFVSVPTDRLLNETYLASRRRLIHPSKATPFVSAGDVSQPQTQYASLKTQEPPSTTHLSIVDQAGNAVSMTNTIERAFGSGLATKSGFLLNNQMTDFDFSPIINGVPVINAIAAGKRPRSSMAPFIVLDKHKKVSLVMGSPGGGRIIAYVLPKMISVLDWKLPLDETLNMPHFVAMLATPDIEIENKTHLDKKYDMIQKNLISSLMQKGYHVTTQEQTSGIHIIQRKNEMLLGSADPRREGLAIGE
jgi:gamma-glutamyltranspeptidase / glutathione hydrolase